MSTLAKLLAILALVLTSFGMTAAPAAAAPHHGASAAMTMPMEHCSDEGGSGDAQGGVAECAMACSAALPAADLSQLDSLTILCTPDRGPVARSLHGLHPDTATPPPKAS